MANGDDPYVSEEDSALTGAGTGAAAGASYGGLAGAAIGAVLGAAFGGLQANRQNDATRAAIKKRNEALFKASVFKDAARKQASSLRTTGRSLGAATPKGSTPTTQASTIPTGSTPTSGAIGSGISSAGNF